jgi:probable rRNA maturation factor
MPMASEQTDQHPPYESVQLFNTTTDELPIDQTQLQRLALIVCDLRKVAFEMVEVVYVDTTNIVEINKTYLERDYITDIITFRLDEGDNMAIEGTIYCCAPRIKEQAAELGQDETTEFARIAAHGFLHLSGMDDQDEVSKEAMTRAEDEILTIWKLTT